MSRRRVFSSSTVILWILIAMTSSCIEDPIKMALDALDKALYRLENQSADIQQTLRDLESTLIREGQSTIRNEVSSTLNRATAQVGVELRCDIDFLRTRVIEDLKRIKARLLGQTAAPRKPVVCIIDPVGGVDMRMVREGRLNNLIFFGYDFNADNTVKVVITRGGQQIDVPQQFVNVPTHYHMNLNLANMLGAGLLSSLENNQFILKWQGKTEYTVAINQAVCRRIQDAVIPSPERFNPPHTRGDNEFDGAGPRVWAGVSLLNRGTQVDAQITMKAEETEADWTTCSGTTVRTIYRPRQAGYRIANILSNTESPYIFRYEDHNHDLDPQPGDGPVDRYEFYGDSGDDDDCVNHTQVFVRFKELRIELVEAQNCVYR